MWEAGQVTGATRQGSHFFKTWDSCRRKWFLSNLAPHPEGGVGLSPRYTAQPLMVGAAVHEGLAAYYHNAALSSYQYDIELAIKAIDAHMEARAGELPDRRRLEEDRAAARDLLYRYHDWYGHEGKNPDLPPEFEIVLDGTGTPVVEREYAVHLPGGYIFTCRVDALVRYRGWLYILEHKTSASRGVSRLRSQSRIDSQFTGECFVLHKLFPDEPIQGVLLNILVKDAAPRGKHLPFQRDTVPRPIESIRQFEHDLINKCEEIERARTHFSRLVEDERLNEWEAGRRCFPLTGTSNGACNAYFRECQFMQMCTSLGHEPGLVVGFRPNTYANQEPTSEDPSL